MWSSPVIFFVKIRSCRTEIFYNKTLRDTSTYDFARRNIWFFAVRAKRRNSTTRVVCRNDRSLFNITQSVWIKKRRSRDPGRLVIIDAIDYIYNRFRVSTKHEICSMSSDQNWTTSTATTSPRALYGLDIP